MLVTSVIHRRVFALSAVSAALVFAFGAPALAIDLECNSAGCTPPPIAEAAYNSVLVDGGSPVSLSDITITGFVPESSSLESSVSVLNGGSLTIDNAVITSQGTDISALLAEGSQSRITANNVSIVTRGEDADGIRVLDGGEVVFSNGRIDAGGNTPVAAVLLNNATLAFDNVEVVSNGKTFHSIFEEANAEQHITVTGKSDFTKNSGVLLHVSRESSATNGVVNLTFDGAEVFAVGDVYDLDPTSGTPGSVNVTLNNGAHWAGMVIGGNTTLVNDNQIYSAPQTFTQDYATSSGATVNFQDEATFDKSLSIGYGVQGAFDGATSVTEDLKAQQNSRLVFNDSLTVNKSITAMDARLRFNGDLTVTDNVAGSGSHFTFSQGGNAVIQGSLNLYDSSSTSGGTVDNPVLVNGNVSVQSNAVLGGNIHSTGTLALQGGQLSPGNSIGTQTYAAVGALPTGVYNAEINSQGQSDLIVIQTGDIDISGIDLVISEENGNGGFKLNHDYRILETETGVVAGGGFKSQQFVSADSLLGVSSEIGATNDFVTVRLALDQQKIQAARNGFSANQNATLDSVMSVHGQNAAAAAALLSGQPGAALNQLSGELHASTASALLNNASMVTDLISQRVRDADAGSSHVLWLDPRGSRQTLDGNRNAAKTANRTYGLFIGGDAALGSGWRLGAALGATRSNIKVNDRNSTSAVNNYSATLYTSNSWKTDAGTVNLLGGVGYTRHNIDSTRSVRLGGAQTLKADYNANSMQLFTKLGYELPVGQASTVEPYLGLSYLNLKTNSFNETGGAAALKGAGQTDNLTTLTVGAHARTAIELGATKATLFGGLGWRHAKGDTEAARRLAFIQGNGDAYSVSGTPISKNAMVLDVGMQASIGKNSTLGVSYGGQLSGDMNSHTGSVHLKVRF